jgi:hypothetical protein
VKPWYSALGLPCPRHLEPVRSLTVDQALRHASQGVGILWQGTYPAARALLDGIRRRLDRHPADPAASFYRYRQQRRTRTRVLGMLVVPLDAAGRVGLPGAPDVRDAVTTAAGAPVTDCLLALRELLGMVSAHEWRVRGLWVTALNRRIHPHYGVFAPTRQEYVDLVASAPLPDTALALDIGTGTGVLAAVLARRGVRRVVATDVSPRAVACARENLAGLPVEVRGTDLFPPERAGLVVCNPPWLPAQPASPLDSAVYDAGGRMLAGFLDGLGDHLTPDGEGWLVLSDLAERFGLRTRADLLGRFDRAGLRVAGRVDTVPRHRNSRGETVSLWRLIR